MRMFRSCLQSGALLAAFVLGAASISGAGPAGQTPAQPPPAAADRFQPGRDQDDQDRRNFYTLEGQGGMIGALIGPDGIFLVDSQFAPLTEKIVAAIKQISTGRSVSWSTRTCTAITPAATRISGSSA